MSNFRVITVIAVAIVFGVTLASVEVGAFSSFGTSSNSSAGNSDLAAGQKAVDAASYEKAIGYLKKAVNADPTSADGYNLLGYSYRKLGDMETALEFYQKALGIDKNHRGANEYIGELYLETNDLAKAEEHLQRLGKVCSYACPEYKDLKKDVKAYKASTGS